jgi:hypothetical protein
VPLEISQQLLHIDRLDTAQTTQVAGLKDSEGAQSTTTDGVGDGSPTLDSSPVEDDDAYDPTTQMSGLSAAMLSSTSPDDELDRSILDGAPTNAIHIPRTKTPRGVEPPIEHFAGSFVDEDKIPTRAVDGLSNRATTGFDGDLYSDASLDETPLVAARSPGVTPPSPVSPPKRITGLRPIGGTPTPDSSRGIADTPHTAEPEPSLSPSMFAKSPFAPAEEPSLTGIQDVISGGQRAEPMVVPPTQPSSRRPATRHDEFQAETRPDIAAMRRGAGLGLIFVMVFLVALAAFLTVGLVLWWNNP